MRNKINQEKIMLKIKVFSLRIVSKIVSFLSIFPCFYKENNNGVFTHILFCIL